MVGRRNKIITLFAASLLSIMLQGCENNSSDTESIGINNRIFHLEVADDDESRQQGLMYRDSILDDGGMLFIFTESKLQSMWMAYCPADIDLIFLDGYGRITALHQMKSQPPKRDDETTDQYEQRMNLLTYSSRYPARFAIELSGSVLEQLNLSVGDKIDLDLKRLKARIRPADDGAG